jgi:hypothetical protein
MQQKNRLLRALLLEAVPLSDFYMLRFVFVEIATWRIFTGSVGKPVLWSTDVIAFL